MYARDKLQIAVIDDGINEKLYDIGPLNFNIEISHELAIDSRMGYDAFLPGHGTTCAAIIKKYAPQAGIGSIKVLNDSSKMAAKHQLIAGIDWCAENKVKLANLSLGTIDFRDFDEIKNCVNRAVKHGLVIVAACNNKNVFTVPCCLSNVIGVKCRRVYTEAQYRVVPNPFDGIDVESSGRHFLTDVSGNSKYTFPANSFAAPLITALISEILIRNPYASLEDIRKNLYESSLNYRNDDYNPYLCMNLDWPIDYVEFDKNTECFYEKTIQSDKRKRKVWSKSIYKMNLQKRLLKKPVVADIPVIAIYDRDESRVLNGLHSHFKEDGYYSVRVSTDCMDVPGGSEYLPEDVQVEQFIALVYKKYNCDIILIKINDKKIFENIEINGLFDIILFVNTNGRTYKCNLDICKSIGITIDKDRIDGQIKDVYTRILNMFEGA